MERETFRPECGGRVPPVACRRCAKFCIEAGMSSAVPPPQRVRKRVPKLELLADPVESARAAGLRYVSDQKPGIRRKRFGKGFGYRNPDGSPVTDPETIRRIRSLAIPPAWTNVWICP